MLREEPAVLLLADTRMPAARQAKTTKNLTSGPGARYLCWHSSAVERHTVEADGKKHRRRFYTGVTTLIHKSVKPALAAMTLQEIGLETETKGSDDYPSEVTLLYKDLNLFMKVKKIWKN